MSTFRKIFISFWVVFGSLMIILIVQYSSKLENRDYFIKINQNRELGFLASSHQSALFKLSELAYRVHFNDLSVTQEAFTLQRDIVLSKLMMFYDLPPIQETEKASIMRLITHTQNIIENVAALEQISGCDLHCQADAILDVLPKLIRLNSRMVTKAYAIVAEVQGGVFSRLKNNTNMFIGFAGMFLLFCFVTAGVLFHQNYILRRERKVLKAKQKQLLALSDYRNQFLANMSHEFRTPLNAIKGFSELAMFQKDTIKKDQLFEYLQIIHNASGDLYELTEQVLDISKIDANQYRLQESCFELSELLRSVQTQLSPTSKEKEIEFQTELYKVWIYADRASIRRCLNNLLENAIKFSDVGGKISVFLMASKEEVQITILDNGCGIPSEELQDIWGIYARSSLTRNHDQQGSGLGLAITKALIEAHDGHIELFSTIGKGVTAVLTLPASRIRLVDDEKTVKDVQVQPADEFQQISSPVRKI